MIIIVTDSHFTWIKFTVHIKQRINTENERNKRNGGGTVGENVRICPIPFSEDKDEVKIWPRYHW